MSALHWFEIPVLDIARAAAFYEPVLGAPVRVVDLTAQLGSMADLLPNRGGVGGALVQNSRHGYAPRRAGTLVDLVVVDAFDAFDARIRAVGGASVLPRTALGQDASAGYALWPIGSEAKRVGLFASS